MNTSASLRRASVAFATVATAGLVLVSWPLVKPAHITSILQRQVSLPATELPPAIRLLPFTYHDVVLYFQNSLAEFPQQVHANEVVFRGGHHPDNFYTITIVSYGSNVLVKFDVVDDYGMTLLREFFEAPFFQWSESEQFYALLDGRNITRSLRLPRFEVVYEYDGRGEAAVISMMFSPGRRTIGEDAADP